MRQQTRSRVATGLARVGLLRPAAWLRDSWLALRADRGPATAPDGLPLPPPRLRLLVDGRNADADRYLRVGALMAASIREAAAEAGSPIEEMEAILDLGCGCGRVARHLLSPGRPELHGCDYNAELVRWCEANLPAMRVLRNRLEPPVPYAAGRFDLVYALSVFSHLSEPLQRAWVAELHRLLRPGGLLTISVLGESVQDRLSPAERERFGRGELVVERPGMSGRNACTAYHPRSYVTGNLLDGFAEVFPFELGGPELPLMQDGYVARR